VIPVLYGAGGPPLFVMFELLLPLVADFSNNCPGWRISDFGVLLMLLLELVCCLGILYTKQSSLAMSQFDSKYSRLLSGKLSGDIVHERI